MQQKMRARIFSSIQITWNSILSQSFFFHFSRLMQKYPSDHFYHHLFEIFQDINV